MCGIAGIFILNGNPVSPVVLQAMTDSIAHRGPDGEGHFIDRNVDHIGYNARLDTLQAEKS